MKLARHWPSRPSRAGFTLVELMVVVILIGIMAALTLPDMKGTFQDALLRSTGRKLANVLYLANSQAITLHQLHRVRLDVKNGKYSLERTRRTGESGGRFVPVHNLSGAEGELDSRITIEIRGPEADAEPRSESQSKEPAGRSAELEKGGLPGTISFYPDGTADDREIRLRDQDGYHLALRINPTTARVRLMEVERE